MPETDWTDPEDIRWAVGEVLRAPDLNAFLDNLIVVSQLTAVKDEILSEGRRSSDQWGPLDDVSGPSVEFLTGPSGNALVSLSAHMRTTGSPSATTEALMSYEIVDLVSNETVVSPHQYRSAQTRSTSTWHDQFTWLEVLQPHREYRLTAVYAKGEGDEVVAVGRRIMAKGVRPVPEL